MPGKLPTYNVRTDKGVRMVKLTPIYMLQNKLKVYYVEKILTA